MRSVGLNVHGSNTVARTLYEGLGYQVTAQQMKILEALYRPRLTAWPIQSRSEVTLHGSGAFIVRFVRILAVQTREESPAAAGPAGQTGRVVTEERLDGGNAGGAVRVGGTVRRTAGPWTPAVHALLAHLASQDFAGSPRPLGLDGQGREVLTFLPGETVGSLSAPARLGARRGHPGPGGPLAARLSRRGGRLCAACRSLLADGRGLGAWGWVIGTATRRPITRCGGTGGWPGSSTGDMAGPVSPGWGMAYAAFSWVPLHARRVVAREGFTDFEGGPAGPAAAVPGQLRLGLPGGRVPGRGAGTGSGRTWPGCAAWPRPAIRCSPRSSAVAGPATWRPPWLNSARSGSSAEYRYPGQWQPVTWPPATVTAAAGES